MRGKIIRNGDGGAGALVQHGDLFEQSGDATAAA
jgi:hypothetical protein